MKKTETKPSFFRQVELTPNNYIDTNHSQNNYILTKAPDISTSELFELIRKAINSIYKNFKEDDYKEVSNTHIIFYLNQNVGYKRISGMEKSIGLVANKYDITIEDNYFIIRPSFLYMLLDKKKPEDKIYLTGKEKSIFDKEGNINIKDEVFTGIEEKTNAVINIIIDYVKTYHR